MRLTRPVLALAIVSAVSLSISGATAATAPKTVSWTDIAGDGNGLNDQVIDGGPGDSGTATPGSQPGADVVKAELVSTYAKVGKKLTCSGFTATMTLSGPPVASTHYRIEGTTDTNTTFLILEHDSKTDDVRYATSATDDNTIPLTKAVKVVGNKIIWTVTLKDFKNIGETTSSVLGSLTSTVANELSTPVASAYLPSMDKAPAPDGTTFKFCS